MTKVIVTIFLSYPIYLLIVTLIYQASVGPLRSTAGGKKNLLGTSLIFSMTFKSLIFPFPGGWILVGFSYSKNFSMFSFTDWRWNSFARQPWIPKILELCIFPFGSACRSVLFRSHLFLYYFMTYKLYNYKQLTPSIFCLRTSLPSSQALLGHFLSFRFL